MESFEQLVERHDRSLRALAFRLLGDRDAMDDVLQEAYVKAFRGLRRFRGRSAPGTWLYRVVYNACLDELRRRPPATSPLDVVDALVPDTVEELAERTSLAEALAALPPADRAVVLLVDADGFDYATAAAILGVPAGTVASRLNRARASLRAALSEGAAHVRT